MLTLRDTKDDLGIRRVTGFCPDSEDYISLVNEATRRLLRRGDWPGTITPIYLCVRQGCVVWPRYVLNVRKLKTCHHTIKPQNMWGDFLPRGRHCEWGHWHGPSLPMFNQGTTSVFQDIMGDGRLVRAYPRCQADIGRTVTLFGTDNNGQQLQTHDTVTNTWTPGVILTLALPFVSTTTYVRHIDYVLKDETNCPVNLYAYNATTNVLEDLAQYDPGETRPSYERTRLSMGESATFGGCSSSPCCGVSQGVTALVKLRFIAAKFDTDLVIIDNLDALKLEIQSIKFGEAGDRANAKALEADAIAELNRQLEDESPDDQFTADDQVFGSATFTNHCF